MQTHLDSHHAEHYHADNDHPIDDRFDGMLVLGLLIMVCAVVAAFIV
ncbi:MAG: hypothetical protein JO218_08405 [Burkholderiales bacterium]|nr:hypothetical protein [Burkholderiales bacterium]